MGKVSSFLKQVSSFGSHFCKSPGDAILHEERVKTRKK